MRGRFAAGSKKTSTSCFVEDWDRLTLTLYRGDRFWLWPVDDGPEEEEAAFPAALRNDDGTIPDTVTCDAHMAICATCHGKGTTVNPAIDGNGLDPHDPDLDADFWEDYHGGVYDIPCGCNAGKVLVLNVDPEDAGLTAVREAIESREQSLWEMEEESRMERLAGA